MVTIQWLVYMVVVCCACLGVLFLLFSFMAKQKEDEIDWSEAISQKEIPYTSDDPDFLSTNRSTVPKKSKPKSAGSTNTPALLRDQLGPSSLCVEEELKKNTKQMESFKGEDAEVIPKNKKLTKDERLALIKESAEKKSFDERLRNRGRWLITERTIYVPKLGNIHSIDSGIGDSYSFFAKKILLILWSCINIQLTKTHQASRS